MGSSLSRHGPRIRTKTQNKKNKKQKTDYKLAQKNIYIYRTKIYMMYEQFKCHDACSNAVRQNPS